ncbi:MAG TPA: hypothetical protein VEZ20_14350 [Allosphingosinicella sp.]|jgi:hypothetical protein|nr:hypothetical protein [Allosphingosinicella sp.]
MTVSALPGITFTLNGKEVSLEQMSASVAAGADFKLSDPVDLGTVTDLVTMITSQFGLNAGDITGAIDALPDPLKGMASRLMNIDVTVDLFEVHVPPSGSTAPSGSQVKGTTFKIGLTGTWRSNPQDPGHSGPIVLIQGPTTTPVLAVTAIYLVVSDDGVIASAGQPPAPPPAPPPQ